MQRIYKIANNEIKVAFDRVVQKKIVVTKSKPEANLIIKLDIFIFLLLCPFHLVSLHHNSSISFHQKY